MAAYDLLERTRDFAVLIIRLYGRLPRTPEAQVLGRQLLRSGTSVGAHMREARRARSDAEMLSKMEVGLQELEESRYWMDLLQICGIIHPENASEISSEASELTAILVASTRNLKSRIPKTFRRRT
ncbi:MAG TPA: four helix bundle protein [Fibrobacteria bacterium]|jgi:four helix bundle protein|nr:four helix bundle protein [Fibrobacteria bacterium]